MKHPVGIALDIIRDWEASLSIPLNQDQHQRTNDLQTWIAGAIAAERERCAKECEEFSKGAALSPTAKNAMLSCAAAIRALK